MNVINAIKSIRNIVDGSTITKVSDIYSSGYPLTWIFNSRIPRTHVRGILCGFPRSGTHWIKNVIEKSAGYTGEHFYTKKQHSNEDILIVKIHARNKIIARTKAYLTLPPHDFGGKYIYVYRDPRDAMISMYEMYKKKKTLSTLDAKYYLDKIDPMGQYRWEINSWVKSDPNNVLLVKYESLKEDPLNGFNRIFEYLDLKFPVAEEFINVMVSDSDRKVRPRGTAYGWKNAPKEYEWLISEVDRSLGKEIKLLGYEQGVD